MKIKKIIMLSIAVTMTIANVLMGCDGIDANQPMLTAEPLQQTVKTEDTSEEADTDLEKLELEDSESEEPDSEAESLEDNNNESEVENEPIEEATADEKQAEEALADDNESGLIEEEDEEKSEDSEDNVNTDEQPESKKHVLSDYRVNVTSYVKDDGQEDYHEEKSYENQKISQGAMIALKLGGESIYCVVTGCNDDDLSLMFSGKCKELDKDSLEELGKEGLAFTVKKDDTILIKPLEVKKDAYLEIYYSSESVKSDVSTGKTSDNGQSKVSKYVDSYKKIISAAYLSAATGVDAPDGEYSYMYAQYGKDSKSDFGYLIADFNKDGKEELFLGENGSDKYPGAVYDIYSFDDKDKIIHLFSGGERNRIYFTDAGVLLNESSSGADSSFTDHYIIEDGSLSKVDIVRNIKKVNIEFHELKKFE